MYEYLPPLAALLLTVLSALSCLRFLFSRQGLYWIIPLIVSVLLCLDNLAGLFNPGSAFIPLPFDSRIFPVIIAFFWYMMVITFHYALKRSVRRNRLRSDMRKNHAEALYLEKIERRNYFRFSRRRRESAVNGAFKPEIRDFKDLDLSSLD